MKKDKPIAPGASRRRFLNLGFLFGLGVVSSSKAQARVIEPAAGPGEKARLITADGQVLEVDQRHIPNFGQAQPVSDAELEQWKQESKK